MNYVFTPIKQDIVLDYLVTVHYYEYPHDFSFAGESHDFWEFLYVDKGEVEVGAGAETYSLKKGDIIFHKPGEFHRLCANGAVAPNLLVLSFVTHSPSMRYFDEKILRVNDAQRDLMAQVIREARSAYSCPLNDPTLERLTLRDNVPFGAEQVIKLSIELMLIQMIRRSEEGTVGKTTSSIRETADSQLLGRVISYLEEHVCEQITLDDVCTANLIGRSSLQKTFRSKTGGGVMEYFSRLKIESAKQYIRDGRHNFTEISHDLGFSTIHYFSRRFKIVTGMTPTEYASSVKSREERSPF